MTAIYAKTTLATLMCLAFAIPAFARPVSYPEAWTIIEETDRQTTALWVHYTLTPKWSLGVRSEWNREQEYLLNGVQATYLAKRWFGENYQANIYALGGAGVVTPLEEAVGDGDSAAFIGILADWETRRLFTSYRARYLDTVNYGDNLMQSVRLGFAPYEGDTGDVHTWLMVEIDHRPDNPKDIGVTPLVRLFKGPALLELGWSITDDKPLFNVTYRF